MAFFTPEKRIQLETFRQAGMRSAANVVLKAQGELLMQRYGLFDEPLRRSPKGVSLMLCRLKRGGGKPRLSLSVPEIYAWLEREKLADPTRVLWRGRSGMRTTTRHGAKGSDKGWGGAGAEHQPERRSRQLATGTPSSGMRHALGASAR